MEPELLIQKALEARQRAYAPYSQFKVGAALLTASGKVFTGCNIENSSFGLTICAERTALFKAISEGYSPTEQPFLAMAVVADGKEPVTPCGACRQVLMECCSSSTRLYLANLEGRWVEKTVGELLPFPFGWQK